MADDYETDSAVSVGSHQDALAPAVMYSVSTQCSSRPIDVVMLENLRMRQIIKDMSLRLASRMRQNSEQTAQVQTLLQALKESDEKRQELNYELEAAKKQAESYQSDWEEERKERLKSDREKEQAKNVILKLQEENWDLRRSRADMLISRGPGMTRRPNPPPS